MVSQGPGALSRPAGPAPMSDPLDILHVCLASSWGGQEMYVLELAKRQRAAGHRPVVACRHGQPLASHASAAGLPLVLYQGGLDRFLFPWKVRRAVVAAGTKVLHAHHLRGLERSFALLPPEVRVVLTEHEFRAGRVLHPWSRLALARVAVVHAISQPLADRNRPFLAVEPERIRVLAHGVDTDRFSPGAVGPRREAARARFGIAPGELAAILPGRICEAKNQAVLVEAAALLAGDDLPVRFLFAGEDKRFLGGAKAYHEALIARIAALGVADRVRFLGFVSPVEDVYAAADLVMIPSHQEAFGLVAIEAMASGTCILAGRGGALPTILDHGRTGLLLPPDDAGEWAAAVRSLAADPARRRTLGDAARAAVAQRFTLAHHDAGLQDLYRGNP